MATILATWSEAACYTKTLEFEDKSGIAFSCVREWLLEWPGAHEVRTSKRPSESCAVIEIEGFPVELHADDWGTTWLQADPDGRLLARLSRAWQAEGWIEVED